jgi:hypothetical protein
MSILRVPTPVVLDLSDVPEHIQTVFPSLITSVALGTRRSYEEQAHLVTETVRHRCSISRIYRDRRFNSRELHWKALKRAMACLAPRDGEEAEWVMSLDGFAVQRGAYTLIPGGISRGASEKTPKKRKARRGLRKGRPGRRRRTVRRCRRW